MNSGIALIFCIEQRIYLSAKTNWSERVLVELSYIFINKQIDSMMDHQNDYNNYQYACLLTR